MNAKEPSSFEIVARLARDYLLPRWPALLAGATCAGLAAACTGALAALLEPAINSVLANHADYRGLGKLPLILGGLAIARGLAAVAQSMIANRIGMDLVSSIQVALVGRLMHADLSRLRGAHSGKLLSQILNDPATVREAATTGLLNYAQSGLTLAALIFVMVSKDWLLSLFVLLAGPVIAWVLRDFSRRTAAALKGSSDGNAALATVVLETLNGVRVVKMAGREDFERDRVGGIIGERRRHIVAGADARAAAAPVSEILVMLMVACVIAYFDWRLHLAPSRAGLLSIEGLTPGSFTAFLVALMAASQSLRQFASLQTTLTEGVAGARRLFKTLDVSPLIVDEPGARRLSSEAHVVSLERVSFEYEPGVAAAITDVSLEARRGETVALVGPSGAGKSTALSLIPRFYDVTAGRVLIGDNDVRDITLASLRAQIALVTQEPFLFDDTIARNIAYSRLGADADGIEAAARQAAAHDFILSLPQGYETRVGEAGLRLSGGQRQRIAIARAFLKNAPVLLLDEATSALDTESEAQVQLALDRLMEGRATIVIAHRLSTVRHADRIYVIDQGRVAAVGQHAELIAQGGLYARLANTQDLGDGGSRDSLRTPAAKDA